MKMLVIYLIMISGVVSHAIEDKNCAKEMSDAKKSTEISSAIAKINSTPEKLYNTNLNGALTFKYADGTEIPNIKTLVEIRPNGKANVVLKDSDDNVLNEFKESPFLLCLSNNQLVLTVAGLFELPVDNNQLFNINGSLPDFGIDSINGSLNVSEVGQ